MTFRDRKSLTFRARSYLAFVLTPRLPIEGWLADLDASVERSKGFFARHPVDRFVTGNLDTDAIASLIGKLSEREIRVLGIEGTIPSEAKASLPPILRGGRNGRTLQFSEHGVVSTIGLRQSDNGQPLCSLRSPCVLASP